MILAATIFALGCFGMAVFLNLSRLLIGPTMGDRVLALDTMAINMIALTILLGLYLHNPVYFELSMVIAMLGFVSTVAYARYALRGNVIE